MIRGDDYRERFAKLKPNVYGGGKIIDRFDPKMVGGINAMAAICDTAFDPAYGDAGIATSHITGEKINRFCHIRQSVENLLNKQKMSCLSSQDVGRCTRCCAVVDARYGGGPSRREDPPPPTGCRS